MKRWLVLAVAAIAIAGFTTVSFAAIQGSHHDLAAYANDPTKDSCYACHGIKAETTTLAGGGVVGTLCWLRCHNGTSGPAGNLVGTLTAYRPEFGNFTFPNITSVAYTATSDLKYTSGHLFLAGGGNIPTPDPNTAVAATGWPYASDTSMQCTTCHDVHSNQYSPFLRGALSTGTASTSFCERCHTASTDGSARWGLITNAPNGSHPSEISDYATAASGRVNNGRYGRTIVFKDTVAADNGAIFRNVSPMGTVLNIPAAKYNPGGKLGQGATTSAYTPSTGGVVGCYTCHAVHIPPTGTTPGRGQLLVAPYRGRIYSDLCVGCHGGTAAAGGNGLTAANPGVTNYYHPVDNDSRPISVATPSATTWQATSGTFNITVNLDNAGIAPLGTQNHLLCASCHTTAHSATNAGVHNGPAGTMLLNARKATCESCHNTGTADLGLGVNSHHAYGGGTSAYARFSGYGYPSTVNYGTVTAVLSDGLQCNDCHVFNGTAHNWN